MIVLKITWLTRYGDQKAYDVMYFADKRKMYDFLERLNGVSKVRYRYEWDEINRIGGTAID